MCEVESWHVEARILVIDAGTFPRNPTCCNHLVTQTTVCDKSTTEPPVAATTTMPPRPSVPAKRPAADAQEAAWVADEDRFVLQQAKRKSAIRAKSGRAAPIDWLAVTLAVIDPERNPLDDEIEDGDLDLVDPESVFEGLGEEELGELEKGIQTYVTLESSRSNLDYWNVIIPTIRLYARD